MKHACALMLLLLLCMACGCWDQRVVERIEYIVNVGVDARPNGQILYSITTPSLQAGGQPKPRLRATVVSTPREGREKLFLQSTGRLQSGKLEQIAFGEAMARRGILDYLDVLVRDPINPVLARLVVVKGTAFDFYKKAVKWPQLPLPGIYLSRLFDQAVENGSIPNTNISSFFTRYYAPGLDPILPLVKATKTRAIVLGAALFRDDKYAGELDVDETYLLGVLRGDPADHLLAVPASRLARGKRKMVVRFIGGRAKLKLEVGRDAPRASYEVSLTGLLEEFQMGYPVTEKVLARVERITAGHARRLYEGIWAKLRRANCDPLGLGDKVRARHNDYWLKHDWREVYPRIEANFRVKVEILNYGVIR